MRITNVEARVKFFNQNEGFGFFSTVQFGDVFVHITKLGTFQPWEMQEGNPAVISFEPNPKKEGQYHVTEIHEMCLFYLKRQGEAFSLPKPFDYPDVAVLAVKDHLMVGEKRTGVLDDIKGGFGFLKVDGVPKKVFVHFKEQMPKGLKLKVGQTFEFEVGENNRGLLAIKLTLVQSEVEAAEVPATETAATPAEVKKAKGPRITHSPKKSSPEGDAAEAASAMAAE
jgi:cold shock CspA family protein